MCICALKLENYVPDYFCGEQINPACEACKFGTEGPSNDPFSAFPTDGVPFSLLSHWIPSTISYCPSGDISSILSMPSHYVKLPDPGEVFTSLEHLLQEYREMMRAQRQAFLEECRQLSNLIII